MLDQVGDLEDRVAAAEVFETAETDSQAIEQLDQLGNLEQAKAELDQTEEAEERA